MATVAAVVVAIASREKKLDRGFVVRMQYVPPSVMMMPTGGQHGIGGVIPISTPERFKLYLRDGYRSGVCYVDRATFIAYREGYWYPPPGYWYPPR